MLDGATLKDVVLKSGVPTTVPHKLTRQPVGWFLTDNQASAVLHRTAWDEFTVTLTATADTTVSLWVF